MLRLAPPSAWGEARYYSHTILSLFYLRLARSQVLYQIANALFRAAAEAVWDIVLRGLVVQTVVVLLVGGAIAVGAFLAGPSPRAVAVRGAAQDFLGNKG